MNLDRGSYFTTPFPLPIILKMHQKTYQSFFKERRGEERRILHWTMIITKIYFPVFQIKFVVSKNCQHLLKKVVFGQSLYRFRDNAGVMTDTGMLSLLTLLGKVIVSFFCATFMTFLAVPVYVVLSLGSWCLNIKWSACRCFELLERPCQRFLLELWWFIGFLSLIIITSCEKNFSQRLPSCLTLSGKHILFSISSL